VSLKPGEGIEMECPFCSGRIQAGNIIADGIPELSVAHTVPPCPKFLAEDALAFIELVNDAEGS
jgi:hypothetical protein